MSNPTNVLHRFRANAAVSLGEFQLVRQLWTIGLPYGAIAFDFWYRMVPAWLYEDLNSKGVPWIGVRFHWLIADLKFRVTYLFLANPSPDAEYNSGWWRNQMGKHIDLCLGVRLMLVRARVRNVYYLAKVWMLHPEVFSGPTPS